MKKAEISSCFFWDLCYNIKAIVSKAARGGSRYWRLWWAHTLNMAPISQNQKWGEKEWNRVSIRTTLTAPLPALAATSSRLVPPSPRSTSKFALSAIPSTLVSRSWLTPADVLSASTSASAVSNCIDYWSSKSVVPLAGSGALFCVRAQKMPKQRQKSNIWKHTQVYLISDTFSG